VTAGSQSLSVEDISTLVLSGYGLTTTSITVLPATATTLSLAGFPASTTAGVAGTATVTARDAYGNVATGYTGTVHFTSSDAAALLPADYAFTAADAGVHNFSATLFTAGSQALSVQDEQGNFSASQTAISVAPLAASTLVATGYSAATTAGDVNHFTITALDAYGNVATGYTGTVHVSSRDWQASLPADYTFTAADAGTHVFPVTLKTAGPMTVTFDDTPSGFTTTANISVSAAAASRFDFYGFPMTTTAGFAHDLTVFALDMYGNLATGYTGTVHFSSSDSQAVLPADYTFAGRPTRRIPSTRAWRAFRSRPPR
jgi:hypothetical protein